MEIYIIYNLCANPDMLLGITEEAFVMDYDASVKSYPIVEKLPYQTMDLGELKQKYQLSAAEYRHLLVGATCAIEDYTDSLCIKVDCPKENYIQVCKEIMYLIMKGLPYHLRKKVTFFSYKSGKTKIYFSDKIEGTNYFDLDTKQWACDKSRLEKYKFTQLYNLNDDNLRQQCFQEIAIFMEKSFDVPLKEMNCEYVEHGFLAKLAKLKNMSSKDVKDLVIIALNSFLNLPLKESETVDNYLVKLLNVVNEYDLAIEDEKLLNNVVNHAHNSVNTDLQESYLKFYARQVLVKDKIDSYEILWKQYQKDISQYHILINCIKEKEEVFYLDYYRNKFLPNRLKDLDSVLSYLEECGETVEVDNCFENLFYDILQKEMSIAITFEEQFKKRNKVSQIVRLLKLFGFEKNEYVEETDYIIWTSFNIDIFNPTDIDLYEQCGLEEYYKRISTRGLISQKERNFLEKVKMVNDLVRALKRIDSKKVYVGTIYSLFFEDERLEEETKKDY